MTNVPIATQDFRHVLGHYPTGVCVITATDGAGAPLGLVVGSFTSVSLDPPLVGFLPGKNSATWAQIQVAGHFCANVLASDQLALCQRLAGKGVDKFAGVDWHLSDHGLPVLDGVLAAIECRIASVTDAGDHDFVLGAVLRLEARRDADPMLFFRGRYGSFAGAD